MERKSKKMIAQEFARALKDRFQDRIVKMILYGSVGRGEETGKAI
jgi:predicted nucleotidyltransferase